MWLSAKHMYIRPQIGCVLRCDSHVYLFNNKNYTQHAQNSIAT